MLPDTPYTEAERTIGQLLLPGRARAISIRELTRLTGLEPRAIKEAVQGLRLRHRLRIGSARGKLPGYYIIETAAEADATFTTLVRQGVKMLRAARAIRDEQWLLEALGQLQMGGVL